MIWSGAKRSELQRDDRRSKRPVGWPSFCHSLESSVFSISAEWASSCDDWNTFKLRKLLFLIDCLVNFSAKNSLVENEAAAAAKQHQKLQQQWWPCFFPQHLVFGLTKPSLRFFILSNPGSSYNLTLIEVCKTPIKSQAPNYMMWNSFSVKTSWALIFMSRIMVFGQN